MAISSYNPPIRAALTSQGYVSELWRKWFLNVAQLTDPEETIYIEKVTAATEDNFAVFNSVGAIKDSEKNDASYADAVHVHQSSTRTITADTALTSADFGKLIIINNGAALVTVTAPAVDGGDIGSLIKACRLGSGSVKVQAASGDTIENGSAGAFIMCAESGRAAANISLVLVAATKWAINGGLGIWENF